MKEIGCTVCHGGEGHRVNDFNSAAHTPRDDKQKAEWVEKYNWHEPHKVPSQCLKSVKPKLLVLNVTQKQSLFLVQMFIMKASVT